jgi:pyruvate formate lyase activating enzyme
MILHPNNPPDVTGIVFNIMRFCVHDGPGIRTTVFLKGCPLRCPWCHNPESWEPGPRLVARTERCIACGACVTVCPNGAIVKNGDTYETLPDRCTHCGTCQDVCPAEARELIGRTMTVGDVMTEVEKDSVFYEESGGGVTFSGGEPLLQNRFLRALLLASKERGLHTAVDTSGFTSPATLEAICASTDLFLYDVKSMDDAVHRATTGVSGALVQGNLRRLASWGKKVIVRMPVIPGVNDDDRNIEATGRFIASLGNVVAIQLLPFHTIGADKYARLGVPFALQGTDAPSNDHMIRIAKSMSRYHHAITIGG